MKALVTGADGFVGQHLIAELLDHGFTVAASALDLPPSRSTLDPEQIASVDWKAADVRDHGTLIRLGCPGSAVRVRRRPHQRGWHRQPVRGRCRGP